MTAEKYLGDWMKVIDRNELAKVLNELTIEYRLKPICPLKADIFRAFRLCPLSSLNIVMLSQDPYPQKDVATGIAFGNKRDIIEENLSPSLKIIKECVINYEIPHKFINFDNSLEKWSKQGILMLNSALTVEMNRPGSHSMLWRQFTAKLLKNLSAYSTGIIYVLFGKQAQTFKPYINKWTNHIIEIEHPAYYARTNKKMPYSLFTDIDKLMKGLYGKTITRYKEV